VRLRRRPGLRARWRSRKLLWLLSPRLRLHSHPPKTQRKLTHPRPRLHLRLRLPAGGVGFDLTEQWDRWVESFTRRLFSGLWEQMKGNARGASASNRDGAIHGGTLVAERLRAYAREHGPRNVRIHLAGHSAGSIFLTELVPRIVRTGLTIDTLAFLGGAVRVDDFAQRALPHLASGRVRRFTTFNLTERLEQDDQCPGGPVRLYNKSLLYLVARGLETKPGPSGIVPLVGLEKGLGARLADGRTFGAALEAAGGRVVICPGGEAPDLRSGARDHGAFVDDRDTMTAVLLGMLRRAEPPGGAYEPNAPVRGLPAAPTPGDQAAIAGAVAEAFAAAAAGEPEPTGATATAGGSGPSIPEEEELGIGDVLVPTEASIAPKSDSPNLDMLLANGWREARGGPDDDAG
jgi:hypothetical protein